MYINKHIHIYIYISHTKFSAPIGNQETSNYLLILCSAEPLKHCTRRTLCTKSLLGRARQRLGTRNHCSGVLRSHCAFEITARARFDTRKYRTGCVFPDIARKITARACSAATGRSKSQLGRASKPRTQRSKCLLEQDSSYSTTLEST